MAQRHALDSLFLDALTVTSLDEFREVTEFLRPQDWASRLDWVLSRVQEGRDACERLRVVLDVLGHAAFRGCFHGLLGSILRASQMQELL